MEPLVITSHLANAQFYHIAWTPYQFQPHNNVHPLANPSYQNFLNRIRNYIAEHEIHQIEHMHTDFHCTTVGNLRGDHSYFYVAQNHVVSPVYFSMNEINQYNAQNNLHNNPPFMMYTAHLLYV